MRHICAITGLLLYISGTWAQQPLISTGGSQPVLGGSDSGDAPSSDQSNQSTTAASNTATGAAQAPVAQAPASAPIPPPRLQPPQSAPAKAPVAGPKPAPRKAGALPPAKGPAKAPARAPVAAPAPSKAAAVKSAAAPGPSKVAVKPAAALGTAKSGSKAPAAAPGPSKSAVKSAAAPGPAKAAAKAAAAYAKAPGPAQAPRDAADIVNIIQARAGAVTRTNTLFLAGVGSRVDWIANLGNEGRRVGRFPVEQFTSDAFNQSSADGTAVWLGSPQAVIQGTLTGQENATTLVAILSSPKWNATSQTLTFATQPVASEAALKLQDGVANGAFAAGRDSGLRSSGVGAVLRDVVVYIDDSSSIRKGPGEKGVKLGLNSCKSINGGPWMGPWIWDRYSGCH